jgi:hypothetical protein
MKSIFPNLLSCKGKIWSLNIVFKNWIEKLNFSNMANILKISVRGFFANLSITVPKITRDNPVVPKTEKMFYF